MKIRVDKIADLNKDSYTAKDLPKNIRYLDTGNITKNKIDELQFLNKEEDTVPSRARRKVKNNSIIYSSVRPNLCHYGILKNPPEDMVVSTGFIVIDVKDATQVDPDFLYYCLTDARYTSYIAGVAETSVSSYPSINPDTIGQLELEIPDDVEEQKKVVRILKKLDEKRRLNDDISNALYEQLTLIYDYWFTQFDFPNENGEPYRQSGGEMVHNDDLDRDIPLGWEVKTLGDLVKLDKEKLPDDATRPCIDLSVMPEGSIFLNELNTSDAFETNLFKMKEKAILFGSIRPYLHKAGIAPCDGAVAGTVYQFLPINDDDYNFALMALTHPRIFDYAMSRKQGTKMPVIKDDKLLAYKVPYNAEVAKKFNELDIASTLANAAMENQQLAQLRDYLLPLLMSGQVIVKPNE